MSEITEAMFRLGRELRYRPLPIAGQRVVIETLDDIEHVLRQLATPWLTRASVWDGTDIELGLAKYGLVDRWCNVEARHLDDAIRGVPALRHNGFASTGTTTDGEALTDDERQLAAGCMIDLAASLGPPVCKVFLSDGLPHDLRFEHNASRYQAGQRPELLPDYFPRGFIVTDACITNAPMIWVAKHFYL